MRCTVGLYRSFNADVMVATLDQVYPQGGGKEKRCSAPLNSSRESRGVRLIGSRRFRKQKDKQGQSDIPHQTRRVNFC